MTAVATAAAGLRWREGSVVAAGVRFHVRETGEGDDVVVLLHGWPQDGSAWRRVAPLLADAGWRVVAPDLKGFGRSDRGTGGHEPEVLADEVAALVRAVHADRVVLVGHDWGGAVAIATALRHPDLVRALVVVSAPYRQLDLRASFHVPLFNLPVLPELAFRLLPSQLTAAALRTYAEVEEPFTDEVVAGYADGVGRAPGAWLAYYRTLSRRVVVDWSVRRLRRVLPGGGGGSRRARPAPVPSLVLWGERDRATPHHLAPRVAWDLGAELVTVEEAGHFLPEEDPLAVARAILSAAARA